MKKLFQFNIPVINEVEVPVIEKDDKGNEIKVLKKEKQETPQYYFIRRPNRSDYDEAELFYAIKFSQDCRNGIITRSEIIKRFANEDVTIKKTYEEYTKKENELQRLSLLEKTEENITKKTKLEQEILELFVDIQTFEINKSSIFEHTAENRARNKTVFWWILNLAYKVDGDKEVPLFDGSTFEEKIASYDKIIEKEDPHLQEVIQKFFYFIPAWYTGQLNKEDEFKKAEDMLRAEMSKQKEAEESKKEESPPQE